MSTSEAAHAPNCAEHTPPYCCVPSAAGAHAIEMVDIFCAAQSAACRRLDERGNDSSDEDVLTLANHIAHQVLDMYIDGHLGASGKGVQTERIARFPKRASFGSVDIIEV